MGWLALGTIMTRLIFYGSMSLSMYIWFGWHSWIDCMKLTGFSLNLQFYWISCIGSSWSDHSYFCRWWRSHHKTIMSGDGRKDILLQIVSKLNWLVFWRIALGVSPSCSSMVPMVRKCPCLPKLLEWPCTDSLCCSSEECNSTSSYSWPFTFNSSTLSIVHPFFQIAMTIISPMQIALH